MTEPYDWQAEGDFENSEYLTGLKDGWHAAVRKITRLSYQRQSQHVHPPSEGKPFSTLYVRLDHLRDTLAEMREEQDMDDIVLDQQLFEDAAKAQAALEPGDG